MRRLCLVVLCLAALAGAACGGARSVTILHTNDLHARFLPDDGDRGGFAYLATAIRQEKAKSRGAIVLFGGDLVQGTPVSTIFEGLPVYEVANLLEIDVATLGNHEFDYGWRKTQEFLRAAEFETVTANMVNGEGGLITGQPYTIREVNGVRLGIIGALTARLPSISKAERVGPWRALPVTETVQRYAREIEGDVDLVVVLSHIFDEEEDEILAHVPEVDLIISGHNHGGQDEVKAVDGRICVKVRAYGRELGRLDLAVDTEADRIASYEWRRIPIGPTEYPPAPDVAAAVGQWEAQVSEVVDVPIGTATKPIRSKQELQPLIEEVMMDAVGADLAYMNLGGIRDGLPQGQILVRHIWNILPFGNAIVYGEVKGAELPPEIQERGPVDPRKSYILATNDFTAGKWAENGLTLSRQGPLVREAWIDWIKRNSTIP